MSSLYLRSFGLSKAPFSLTPDTEFFFRGEARGALLEAVRMAVTDDNGIVVVMGEVGTGKTIMARMLRRSLEAEEFKVIYLPDASLDTQSLMLCIADGLGVSCKSASAQSSLVPRIQKALAEQSQGGRPVVLLADESHTFKPEALDALRMLGNVESDQQKAMQMVLFGQPELDRLLRREDLRQVRDRVVHWFTLGAMSSANAVRYLEHRLGCAGNRGDELITPDALQAIAAAAKGRPRALNMLADKALLCAYAQGESRVTPTHVEGGLLALQPEGVVEKTSSRWTDLLTQWLSRCRSRFAWQAKPAVVPVSLSPAVTVESPIARESVTSEPESKPKPVPEKPAKPAARKAVKQSAKPKAKPTPISTQADPNRPKRKRARQGKAVETVLQG
jgi:type II secretory pathway predicted ATPase ExeA